MAMFDLILGDTHCLLIVESHCATMRISGHWSGENALKISRLFSKSMDEIKTRLVLDLEGCRSIDDPALSILLKFQGQLEAVGKKMELVGIPADLLGRLDGTQLIPRPLGSETALIER